MEREAQITNRREFWKTTGEIVFMAASYLAAVADIYRYNHSKQEHLRQETTPPDKQLKPQQLSQSIP
ncbi:MAG: hypothetical protein A3J69_01720 [Candidatus Levybacteria bacterium RIFCSPHIGHO2_02_FULL_42_12]|nr:MAG: hypothetical protein A2698_00975 [Candidatus Levybacteria bacterium RIFCSPHIGHO2_01_FULL_42_15]OGH33925.1 MAG: hypothetical protein A3J69_01720 [Candidatus Levybacteria bacterium RIFCSPHIGHO2_02_FULL_42_12]OGH43053.1 MAG: hypothetical protein A3B53_02700 [Candidatus Levybacteria bacterium RIFCSPLOWO2_01_FULL_42_15]